MKVKGFNNRLYTFPPPGHIPLEGSNGNRSELHLRARKLLGEMYPCDRALEEVPLPGSSLFADFYLPSRKIVIECHGEQHYKFVSYFHSSPLDFFHSQANDRLKKEWCELNNIGYVELPFDENDEKWKDRIKNG